ncbi:PQQ-binding-like beta-propeller repeat protein [Schlesneria sp. T3-172]|uniref:outer membrane protein assembly factor BamB family protein n=1 Tax=Schlesneria sphaerica TaxID=3373610 RepID=UPI0037C9DC62
MIRQRTRQFRPWLIAGCLLSVFLTPVLTNGVLLRAADDAEPAKEANPTEDDVRLLKGLFRELFNPRANGQRRQRDMGEGGLRSTDEGDEESPRDSIDSRAPHDTKNEQVLQAAERAVRQKNWKQAIELLQKLLDQSEDSLHRAAGGSWQSMRKTANQMLGQMPESILQEYRGQYSGLAQQQLEAAKRSGLTRDFVNVATRYFHTPAGYEAANYLGSLHFDRSEFGLAARWFEELIASPASLTRNDRWKLQAILAVARSGKQAEADALLNQLSQGRSTLVTLGGGSLPAADWLGKVQFSATPQTLALADWTQLYGTAARLGTAVGGDPLLSPDWFLPLTSSHTVRNALKWLVQDLQDQQRAQIMASSPLVMDGKVVYRDLRGIRSVNLETGRPLWESVEGISPERILGGLPSQQIDLQDGWRLRGNAFQNMNEFQGSAAEYSPLTSLLFRDGAHGIISGDGNQLFVIEEHGILSRNQPGQHWGWDGNPDPQDPFGLPWKTNRLVSYDLHTGRTLWTLGGSESRESFDPPLAGTYFYGTPAVAGEELFVVASKGDDIRLWSLDRQSGSPLWSQLIAYSDTKIDLDIARRWITSQVAVGDGVIVCPTTVGWIVAIDQLRKSVLWAHRYAPATNQSNHEREPGSQLLPQRELNALWCPSAPIISGNYVVYTPQEEPVLICLNATDGRRVWDQPKNNGLYLAGVFDQKVVVVGETSVVAYQLTSGNELWTAPFDEGVLPSGRGVVVEDHFYVPLSNGELRTINLKTGELVSRTFVASQQPPLGNLAMHRGKLVSLSPAGLTAFGQRDALLRTIQDKLAADPNDAWALLRSSEIQLLNRQYPEAIQLLRKIDRPKLSEEEQARHHSALVESLSTLIHEDVLNRGTELEELRELAETPAERLLFQELSAERLLAENKPLEAFDVFLQLASDPGSGSITRTDNTHVTSSRTVWLSGRMFDLWQATPEDKRIDLDQRISAVTTAASEQSREACQATVRLFSFHPAAVHARFKLLDWLVAAEDFASARLVLEQLTDSSDRSVSEKAIEQLARMMVQLKQPADAVHYYQILESQYGDVVVREGVTGSALAAEAKTSSELDFGEHQRGVTWPSTPLRSVQSVVNYSQPPQNVTLETQLPFFDRLSFDAYPNEQRLAMESVASGNVEWMVPLRSAVRGVDEGPFVVQQIGHQLFFISRGILHAVSPVERKILWSRSLDENADGITSGRHSSRPLVFSMMTPASYEGIQGIMLQRAQQTGSLAIAQPTYLCVYGRRSFSVIDPQSGEILWTLDGLPTNAIVAGHRDAIFSLVPGKDEVSAYRALDGKPLIVEGGAKILNNALTSHGSSLLVLDQDGPNPLRALGLKREKVVLRLHDPVANATQWKMEFPAGSVVSLLGDDEVVVLKTDGQIQRIDIATGRATSLESIPAKKAAQRSEKYLFADADRIYLIVNSRDHGNQTYGESLASIRMNGTLYCWNRKSNAFMWPPCEVKNQNLVVDRFSTLPVILCVSRSWKQRGRINIGTGTLNITAIHKQTGQKLIDSEIPSAFSGFHAISFNVDEPSIDLKSYNMRMRLVPTDGPVAAAPETKPAAQANN